MGLTRFRLISYVAMLGVPLILAAQNPTQPAKSVANTNAATNEVTQLALQARAYWDKGDYTNALPLFERVLEMSEKQLGADNPLLARQLILLATMYNAQGGSDKALSCLKRSLEIAETMAGTKEYEVAMIATLLNMGLTYRNLMKYSEAISAFQRCLEIQENVYGADSTNCCSSLKALADIYSSQANYDKALTLYSRWLAITQKALGLYDPSVAIVANNVARICKDKGDYAKALSIYLWALDGYEKAHGSNHVGVATILDNIAEVQILQLDHKSALLTCQRALAIRESSPDNDQRELFRSWILLATIQRDLGNRDEALRLYRQCLDIENKLSRKDEPQLAIALLGLAGLHHEQGDYQQAMDLSKRALEIYIRIFGEEHPNVAYTLDELASICFAQGRRAKVRPLLVRSLELKRKAFGTDHPAVMHSMFNLAMLDAGENEIARALESFRLNSWLERRYLCSQLMSLPDAEGMRFSQALFFRAGVFQSLCGLAGSAGLASGKTFGAEQLAIHKALLEEMQATRAALEANPDSAIEELSARSQTVQTELAHLRDSGVDPTKRDERRRELEAELSQLVAKIAQRERLIEQGTREWKWTQEKVAESLPKETSLIDFVQYRRYDFAAKTNQWKEQRYAAYLTFPLAHDSTNVLVERVDLGEAAPINEAVELVCKRMSAGQFAAKDLPAALQKLSQLVYAPLAKHLTNVLHLIVCPDGQLSRLPFEMLPSSPGYDATRPVANKFLVEEKTISYVTSGREVVRLQTPPSQRFGAAEGRAGVPPAQANAKSSQADATNSPAAPDRRDALSYVRGKSLVMGNPDFDLDLTAHSRRREEAEISRSSDESARPDGIRLLTSADTRALSRDFHGLKFNPLPGSALEATNVVRLLGADATLRLGPDAREAQLKAVQSPRVLHLATHGFFLSDQEFRASRREPPFESGRDAFHPRPKLLAESTGTRWNASLPQERWENPLVRCGLALAGANHFANSELGTRNSELEDGLLTGLEAALLNLQGTDLVILSACDSGTGEVKIGEGVMSLRRAFRIAGAETVLASHWKVSDKATSQLMTEFMRRWQAGEPRAKAWREAQLALLRSKDFSNPYFWAAFTLTGQWN